MHNFTMILTVLVAFTGIYYDAVAARMFSHMESSGHRSVEKQFEIPAFELGEVEPATETVALCKAVMTSLPVTEVQLISQLSLSSSQVEQVEIFSCDHILSQQLLYCNYNSDLQLICPGYQLQQLYTPDNPATIGQYPYPPGGLLLRVKYLNTGQVAQGQGQGQVAPVRVTLTEQDSASSMNTLNEPSFFDTESDFLWQFFNEMQQEVTREQGWKLSWAGGEIGTVSGVAVLNDEFMYAFHRAGRNWEDNTFSDGFKMTNTTRLAQNTILKCHVFEGNCVESFGSDLFLMPHGISVTPDKNLLVTDTGRHQVFMLDAEGEVMLELGEDKTPGSDSSHFCQPADAEMDPISGLIFVADGYCNQRVAVFNQKGEFQTSINECNGKSFQVVHDLAIDSKRRVLFVADRENNEVCMYSLQEKSFGKFIGDFSMGDNSVYALDYNKGYLYAVGQNRKLNAASGFILAVESEVDSETTEESSFSDSSMKMPHDVSVLDNKVMFVADLKSPLRVLKFYI